MRCARNHPGAIDIISTKCEDCKRNQPSFGMLPERKRRWCAGCAKGHEGAASLLKKRRVGGGVGRAAARCVRGRESLLPWAPSPRRIQS